MRLFRGCGLLLRLLGELDFELGLHDVHDGLANLALLVSDGLDLLHLLCHVLDFLLEILLTGGDVLLEPGQALVGDHRNGAVPSLAGLARMVPAARLLA